MAIKAFEIDYGAKIVDHADVLLEFYRYPAERWIHPHHEPDRMHFATVRLPTKITKGSRSHAAGLAMACSRLLALVLLAGPMVRTGLACLVRKVLDEAPCNLAS